MLNLFACSLWRPSLTHCRWCVGKVVIVVNVVLNFLRDFNDSVSCFKFQVEFLEWEFWSHWLRLWLSFLTFWEIFFFLLLFQEFFFNFSFKFL